MKMQKSVFLEGEGDAWTVRNPGQGDYSDVLISLDRLKITPRNVLEIGCGRGLFLAELQRKYACSISGIDPSATAISEAKGLIGDFKVGTADYLEFENDGFDLVIFGFCLYLADPQDYFRIVQEADRVLSANGAVIIRDFCSPHPRRNVYRHAEGVYSHKMEFSKLFTSHPAYRLVSRLYSEHSPEFSFDQDEQIATDVILRSANNGF